MKEEIDPYEKRLILLMIDEEVTLSEAVIMDMFNNMVDINSVFDMCDYLEEQLENLDHVEYYMDIVTGRRPDQYLVKD